MEYWQYTNTGNREENQDYAKCCPLTEGTAIFVVTDGMGGYSHGDVAAKVVAEAICDFAQDNFDKLDAPVLLKEAIEYANESLSIKRMALGCKQMGCVAVVLLLVGDMAYMAWVGDSRIYLYRNGKEAFRTTDHSMCNDLAKIKTIRASELEKYSSVVTRAIMGDDKKHFPDLMKANIKAGDVFVLCSDGLHRQISIDCVANGKEDDLRPILDSKSPEMMDNYTLIKVAV